MRTLLLKYNMPAIPICDGHGPTPGFAEIKTDSDKRQVANKMKPYIKDDKRLSVWSYDSQMQCLGIWDKSYRS